MRVRFCGVRGSTPAPGHEFARVGGHTSSLAVTPDGSDRPRLLLDAGTGIRTVSELLEGEPFVGTVLLTHLHWDHTQGLPFFVAADRDDAEVRVLLPSNGDDVSSTFARVMSPPHFPIGPDGLRGQWWFEAIEEGCHDLETISVRAAQITHKGGRTFGYRLADATGTLAYLPDHVASAPGRRGVALGLAAGVDVLVHDAQFVTSESGLAHDFGHSTVDEAVEFALEAGVGELVLFHHAPGRTDTAIDDLVRAWLGGPVTVTVAFEGREVTPGS